MPQPDEFKLVLSPDSEAGWRVRHALRERYAGSMPRGTVIDLVAVVTELVNNAVKHGPGRPVTVGIVVGRDTVRGEVSDQGNPAAAIPDIKRASAKAGHGLQLVDKLTSRWEVFEGSTHVWFEMPLDP